MHFLSRSWSRVQLPAWRSFYVRSILCHSPICGGIFIDNGYRFDPASLAILQRLDGLEDLLRGRLTDTSPHEETKIVQTPASLQKNLDSPALERTADSIPCYINIEAVLAWPVFDEQNFGPHLDLRSLLQANSSRSDPPLMSVSSDFDLYAAPQLLQQFLENVHIFNPVLEEAKVKEYMLEARFNGLGWDARSCLLVMLEITIATQEADFRSC